QAAHEDLPVARSRPTQVSLGEVLAELERVMARGEDQWSPDAIEVAAEPQVGTAGDLGRDVNPEVGRDERERGLERVPFPVVVDGDPTETRGHHEDVVRWALGG